MRSLQLLLAPAKCGLQVGVNGSECAHVVSTGVWSGHDHSLRGVCDAAAPHLCLARTGLGSCCAVECLCKPRLQVPPHPAIRRHI